jgi:hypothetical protein
MELLTDIAVEFDPAALAAAAGAPAEGDDARAFADLVQRAARVARPKAAYRECYVDARADHTVTLAGVTFTSRALRRNLDGVQRAFAFVTTCGRELDQLATDPDDYLQAFWMEAIRLAALAAAGGHLARHLARRYGLGKTAVMSPGAGDAAVWPIQQQRLLFDLLGDVEAAIGVTLTDSFLMVPTKSGSGIRFATEVDFRSCQLCRRDRCPSRSAPFDAELWESLGHE